MENYLKGILMFDTSILAKESKSHFPFFLSSFIKLVFVRVN